MNFINSLFYYNTKKICNDIKNEYLYKLSKDEINFIKNEYKGINSFDSCFYITKKELAFSVMVNGCEKTFVIKPGFVTNGASSPFSLSDSIEIKTCIAHDYLYSVQPCDKDTCDSVLLPIYRRYIVKYFGKRAWKTSSQYGALFICKEDNGVHFKVEYSDSLKITDKIIECEYFGEYFSCVM
jgi:hypothetical protein